MSPAIKTPEQIDGALMGRVQANDSAAFAELYDRHAARALRVAHSVCHDPSRAEEAVQEGFLSIWRRRANYQPELGSFQAWAMRIVQNRAIDSVRKAEGRRRSAECPRREQPGVLDEEAPDVVSAPLDDEVIARSESDALRASVQRLPNAQAVVITLAFFGGLSHSEIATQLALPAGTVKGRMRLGLEKLRRQMLVADAEGDRARNRRSARNRL